VKKGPLVWQQPKIEHQKHFMLRLLQTPIKLIIVCMRAKYPMQQSVVKGKKEWVRSELLVPKQSEDILYELFVHGWIDEQHRFRATKYTRPDLASVIPDGQPITIATGAALASWSKAASVPSAELVPSIDGSEALQTVLERIGAARSVEELVATGTWSKGFTFDAPGKTRVNEAYRVRRLALKGEQVKPGEAG
jgi:hypothetical protein